MAKRDPRLVALGVRVAALRKERKLTQEQLAERADLGSQYISEIERGVTNPTLHILYDVARALGTTVARLLASADESDFEIMALLRGRSRADHARAVAMVRLLFAPMNHE